MPNYRRIKDATTYFFTIVTHNRLPIFISETARNLLHDAFSLVGERHPFSTDAICLLPDHLHCIWTLPEGDSDYSYRWKEIKRTFSHQYLRITKCQNKRNVSQQKRDEAALWQRRFWEHMIRDEMDLERHIEYIHFNPVKHGYVNQVKDWPWSSFHRYVRLKLYDLEWGQAEENVREDQFGE